MAEQNLIQISNDVVAVIAGLTASRANGIASMSGGITEGWAKRVGGKNMRKGVSVEAGEVETAVSLRVIVEFGVPIHDVCRKLQKEVKHAIENMTGLSVVEVNVKVEGVEIKEKNSQKSDNHFDEESLENGIG
ncbi:Asp23/Gls24 family envelope stress response protein [Shimazuella sp. AN120528]|uniref:Asp23/Gls24 family envelope stress response protein n=1 Tax=Shimazuella soli TaxID=1892854 RepID=UPI001F1140BE|nr:Asp23/Gls24 family envelope stress response protein [Shimazuella soli]MCH5583593.1 Asp23/Gls24 family envelope stress response protein [Shimazuella soli]